MWTLTASMVTTMVLKMLYKTDIQNNEFDPQEIVNRVFIRRKDIHAFLKELILKILTPPHAGPILLQRAMSQWSM